MANSKLIHWLLFLWNGGLTPETSDPAELRLRRTISSIGFVLFPVAIILMIVETFVFGDPSQNYVIGAAAIFLAGALATQAWFDATEFAIHSTLCAFWIAPTAIIFQLGLNTTNWVWLLPISLVANLVGRRAIGVFWTCVTLITLVSASALTLSGYLENGVKPENHAISASVAGGLLTIMLGLAGYTFRTFQHKTESILKANLKRLEREIEIRTEAERKAQAGERAKAVFLAAISHELRTPLNGVMGASELLQESTLDREQAQLVKIANDSSKVLLDLINNVLDLTKLEAEQVTLNMQPFNIRDITQSVISPYVLLGEKKGITFRSSFTERVPTQLLGDATHIRQIILNLCGNSLKFTDHGEVQVTLDYFEGTLNLIVEDTGSGISDELLPTLFTPFGQSEGSTEDSFTSTGIGLTIVSQLVNLMQGKVKIESELTVGTRVEVSLPLATVEEKPQQGEVSDSDPKEAGEIPLNVLVADDNEVNRLVVSKILQRLRHNVIQVEDGLQALKAAEQGDIDVVLMDIQMPVMDGLEATAAIRALDGPENEVPIIALTAHAMASDRTRLLDAGMDEYLAKPVRKEAIQQTIRKVINQRETSSL